MAARNVDDVGEIDPISALSAIADNGCMYNTYTNELFCAGSLTDLEHILFCRDLYLSKQCIYKLNVDEWNFKCRNELVTYHNMIQSHIDSTDRADINIMRLMNMESFNCRFYEYVNGVYLAVFNVVDVNNSHSGPIYECECCLKRGCRPDPITVMAVCCDGVEITHESNYDCVGFYAGPAREEPCYDMCNECYDKVLSMLNPIKEPAC